MANNTVKAPSDAQSIVNAEYDTQNEAVHAMDTSTRKKFGPAAGHFGGNPTVNGGINRPAKGK